MNKLPGFLLLTLLLVSCAGNSIPLPKLTPAPDRPPDCAPLFPQGNYQFVHLIECSMPGGNHGTAMGVTVTDSNGIESALMTVEGFVLFAARFSDTLTVHRAVPPFDKPGFASGMMQDIRAIFLHPKGKAMAGSLPDSTPVCRMTDDSGQITDILSTADHCRQRNIYSPARQLLRTISGHDCTVDLDGSLIPKTLELTSWEMGGYTLQMTLISAENINSITIDNYKTNKPATSLHKIDAG